jgi:glucosamine-phosphate N-acetyltransferase
MDYSIRELREDDLPECFLETLTSLAEVGLTIEEARELCQERERAGIRTYVASDSEQIIGTASLLIEHKFIHKGGRVGTIEDVAVHREFKGQGIGSALVRHLVEEARRLGCYKVLLNCTEQLVPFYSELGFHAHSVSMRLDF